MDVLRVWKKIKYYMFKYVLIFSIYEQIGVERL